MNSFSLQGHLSGSPLLELEVYAFDLGTPKVIQLMLDQLETSDIAPLAEFDRSTLCIAKCEIGTFLHLA